MNQQKGTITSSDGCRLFWQSWMPETPPEGAVFIVHGIGDHSSRYGHVAQKLAQAGILTFAIDLRGHGHSAGMRNYVRAFQRYIDDVAAGWRQMQKLVSDEDLPRFLFGHSMGTLVTIHFLDQYKPGIKGWVASAALAKVNEDLSPFLIRISGLLAAWLPRLKTIRLDLDHLTRDPAVIEALKADALYYKGGVRARTGREVLEATQQAREILPTLDYPLLAMHGGADKVTKLESSELLVESVPARDKKLVIYPDAYHELVNEPNKEEVIQTIISWVKERCS